MMRAAVCAVTAALFIIAAGVCHAAKITVTEAHNNTAVGIKTGDVLQVVLEGNPVTGYAWRTVGYNRRVLTMDSKPYYKPKTQLGGSGGYYLFRFVGAAKGFSHLKFIYHRPWEKDVPPAKVFTVRVDVGT